MTIQAQIEVLEKLAAIDAELKELVDMLGEERRALEGKRAHLASLEERLARGRKSVGDMDKMRGDLHAEVRQMSVQIEKSREKLSRCRTEREANAAQRELEELRKLYRDREVEIEKIDALVDQARGEIEQVTGEHRTLTAELDSVQGEVTGRLAQAEKSVAEKESVRQALVSKVQPALYRRYELVRKRRGTAIAATTDGTCSACHMRLQPMLFQQLTHSNEFSQCPSCSRILYFRPGAPEADSQSGTP